MYNSLFSIHQVIVNNIHHSMCPCARIVSSIEPASPRSKSLQTQRSCRPVQLPMEMVLHIFSFLDGDDLASSCYTVCRAWHLCSKDETTWKRIFYSHEDVSLFRITMNCSWYEAGKWFLYCTKLEFDDRTRKNGRGHFTFPNGESYFGEWRASKFDGFGVCMWADGRKYQGLFREGKRSGYGIFTWPSGCRYEGEWQEDKRHGKGRDTWPDSSSFVGEYKQDKFDGWGIFRWEDGGLYEGHWKEDHRHGFGTHKWKDGRVFQGEFSQDRFVAEMEGPFEGINPVISL